MRFNLSKGFLLLLSAGFLFLAGCASTDHDNMSERPWNSPKNWEHGMPTGIMRER
ncbi:MAG TPA: hypothetical protein VEH27_09515 [Methylomirabilota bacterium]|nr:hypothetical protein [Methylomirabilota bacterium]